MNDEFSLRAKQAMKKIVDEADFGIAEENQRRNLLRSAKENDINNVKKFYFMSHVNESMRQDVLETASKEGFLDIAKFCVESGMKPFKKVGAYAAGNKCSAFQIAKIWNQKEIISYFQSTKK